MKKCLSPALAQVSAVHLATLSYSHGVPASPGFPPSHFPGLVLGSKVNSPVPAIKSAPVQWGGRKGTQKQGSSFGGYDPSLLLTSHWPELNHMAMTWSQWKVKISLCLGSQVPS